MEVQWFEDDRRCLALSESLAGVHFEALGEWATGQEVLGSWVDAEFMTIFLLSGRWRISWNV